MGHSVKYLVEMFLPIAKNAETTFGGFYVIWFIGGVYLTDIFIYALRELNIYILYILSTVCICTDFKHLLKKFQVGSI